MLNTPIYPYCSYEDYSWVNIFSILFGNGSLAISIYPSTLFLDYLLAWKKLRVKK